ncbi:hypothetical protein MMC29_004986 [Sticta canariensis]|nr:hypothetical protein [Sticta canariensis]
MEMLTPPTVTGWDGDTHAMSSPPVQSNSRHTPRRNRKSSPPVQSNSSHTPWKNRESSPPVQSNMIETPRRNPKPQTPSRSTATPSQAYAGPLFHASPAASALPIPKWFSKTVNERKAHDPCEAPLEEIVSPDRSSNGRLQQSLPEFPRPSTAPSGRSIRIMDDEEKRKAVTLALKKLLQTPGLRLGSSGPSTPIVSPAVKPTNIPRHSRLPSSGPHHNTPKSFEGALQSDNTTQYLAPCNEPHGIDNFDDSLNHPRTVEGRRPLSYGQRCILMENYLTRGTSFECRRSPTSLQFAQDLDQSLLTNAERAKLLEDYIQRRSSPCSCKSGTSSPQSSSSIPSSPSKDDDRSKRMRDYLRSGNTFKCRPTLTSPQSFPGADSKSVVEFDPKMWLDNHLRNDILKIGSHGATGVAT